MQDTERALKVGREGDFAKFILNAFKTLNEGKNFDEFRRGADRPISGDLDNITKRLPHR